MKRFVIALIFLLLTMVSYAQMLPDSTVQVCAYWVKGDVMEYESTRTVETIGPDGTSTKKRSSSQIMTFEVMDETEHSYTLKTSYRDVFSSDINLALGEAASAYSDIAEKIEVYTKTDEFGSIEEVINIDKTVQVLDEIIPITVDALIAKNGKKAMRELGITKETLVSQLRSMLCTSDAVVSMCKEDVAPLLYYHGGVLGMNDEYVVEEDFDNILGGSSLTAETSLWVDTEQSDSSFVVLRSYTLIENDKLLPVIMEASIASIKATLTDQDQIQMAVDALEESFEGMSAELEQYTTTLIHLDSGWTVAWHFDRDLVIKDAEGETHSLDSRHIVLHDDE